MPITNSLLSFTDAYYQSVSECFFGEFRNFTGGSSGETSQEEEAITEMELRTIKNKEAETVEVSAIKNVDAGRGRLLYSVSRFEI